VVAIKAAACGYLGHVDEGREYVRSYRELRPGATVASAKEGWSTFVSPEFLAVFLDGLRKAGLPEEYRAETRYTAFARSSTALSSTLQPAVRSSGLASSISLWLMPPTHGTKTIALGATRAM
jgi:hypothetical protein